MNRIEFLQNCKITSIASGSDFSVALIVRNKNENSDDEKLSTMTSKSERSCPLGLPLNYVTEEGETVLLRNSRLRPKSSRILMVTPSKKLDSEEKEDDETEDIKRLAKSGMYLAFWHARKKT